GDTGLFSPGAGSYTLNQGRLVFTFDGVLPADLHQTTTQNFTVAPEFNLVVNRDLGDGTRLTGPVITGVRTSPAWRAAANYTFNWVQPTAADLHYRPSVPVTVNMLDVATVAGN